MSSPSSVAESPVTHRDQLVAYIAEGEKPREAWRIGTEHEKFGFRFDDLRPPTFDGDRGIEALLKGLARFGWAEVPESVDGNAPRTIALSKDGASVTLPTRTPAMRTSVPFEMPSMRSKRAVSRVPSPPPTMAVPRPLFSTA